MERNNLILGTAGALVLALFLSVEVVFAVEAPGVGNMRQTGPAAESQRQIAPALQPSPKPPMMGRCMGAEPMGAMGTVPGTIMSHPCGCGRCGSGPTMGPPMMGGMKMHMMGMGMLAAARKDPKGVALMMRMHADMLRLRAQMLEGRAKILEKYANEIETGTK